MFNMLVEAEANLANCITNFLQPAFWNTNLEQLTIKFEYNVTTLRSYFAGTQKNAVSTGISY